MMKKILGLMLGIFLTVSTFANGGVTYTDSKTAEKSKTEGVFHFMFDTDFSKESIDKAAKYYTSYFTVTPLVSEIGVAVEIRLVDDNEMARRVITRFFISLEVRELSVGAEKMSIDDFIAKYVMV